MNLNGFLSMTGNVSGSLGADLVVDVEANPSGVATQPLIKLRVGDVIYAIPTGGGGGGTSDYNLLTNKPKINGIILQDELSLHSLGIQEEITFSGEATEYLNGEGYFSTPPFYVPINYDTAEQDTGIKWIDGKEIYQKIITPIISTNSTLSGDIKYGSFTLANYIDNVDMAWIDINMSYYLPVAGQTRGFILGQYEKDSGSVTLSTMYSRSNVQSILCIRYTKS